MNSSGASKSPSAETADPVGDRVRRQIAHLRIPPERSLDLCFIGLILLALFYLLQWPIAAFDTDLWTHLNGGRYLVEHGKIPRTSFYSFVSPQREIISYSWLFKAFVYELFRFFGYHGLIIFRTLVCTATLTVVFFCMRKRGAAVVSAALFVLYFLLFADSGEGIRPYNVSYLLIALFLFIIERHPQKLYLLPALAVVWINFHGVEYPVMVLIVVCYLAAYFRDRWKQGRQKGPHNYRTLVSLALCMVAVFASPYGTGLLRVPFTDITYASQYIDELRSTAFSDLFQFYLVGMVPDFKTVANLLIFSVLAVVLLRARRREIPLHHLVLFVGGCYLLSKGIRFVHEFALLSLPCLAAGDRQAPAENGRTVRTLVPVAMIAVLLAVSFLYMKNLYGNRPNYPVTRADLPIGVTAFLHHVGAKGRILNDPATGGYMSWKMWPESRIHMDMQVPFLFTDKDFFEGVNAIYEKEAFLHFIARYEPDFLSLPIRTPLNKEAVIRSEGYVPVFFDDREILYVQRKRHQAIADQHELKTINPAVDGRIDIRSMSATAQQDFLSELQRLARIYPEGLTVNRLLSIYYAGQKDFQRAVEHAERIIRNFPNHAGGYLQKASVLKEMKAYAEALKTYRQALGRLEKQQRAEVYRAMGECHYYLQQYREAYQAFLKSGNIFSPSIGYFDLYRLAAAAYKDGKLEEARMLAQFAAFKQPYKQKERDPRIDNLLRTLEKTHQ